MTVQAVSDDNFEQEVRQSELPVLVDFWATWCGPCKAMAPALDQVAEELAGKVKVVKIDVDANPATMKKYDVRAMPTMLLFKDGMPRGKHMGGIPQKQKLKAQIEALIARASSVASTAPRPIAFKLDNGMDVIVIPDPDATQVSHTILFKVGSGDAPEGSQGIAEAVESLMFGTTELLAQNQVPIAVTTRDFTIAHQSVTKAEFAAFLQAEADRVARLELGTEWLAKRQPIVERLGRTLNYPLSRLHGQMAAVLAGVHPSSAQLNDPTRDLEDLSGQAVSDFLARFYGPNNAVLAISGNVTPDEIRALVEATYGRLQAAGEGRLPLPAKVMSANLPARTTLAARARGPELHRWYVAQGALAGHRLEAEALKLLADIMTNRKHGRLQKLVESKLATQAYGFYNDAMREGSALSLAVVAGGGDVEAIEAALDAVIDDIRANGVTEDELACAKEALTPTGIYQTGRERALAVRYAMSVALGRSLADIEASDVALAKVTTEDVRRVAVTYLNISRSVTGWLLPAAVPAAALANAD